MLLINNVPAQHNALKTDAPGVVRGPGVHHIAVDLVRVFAAEAAVDITLETNLF